MFVHIDDEGTVNIFSPSRKTVDALVNGLDSNRDVDSANVMVFCTEALNAETCEMLAAGLRENFRHEDDLRFEVTYLDDRYSVKVTKNLASL